MVEDNESIFVSYRRDETAAYAGWLADSLGYHFGKQKVFRDIGSIEPGMDFVEAIETALESCAVMLVVMGRNWTTALKEYEQTGQEDYTRLEVATALRRNVRVIPVLVQGASMPRAEELPNELAALRRRQAIELHDTSWERDVEHLIAVLEKVGRNGEGRTKSSQSIEQHTPRSPAHGKIRIRREEGWDWRRHYRVKVLLDGAEVANLGNGAAVDLEVETGPHKIEIDARSMRRIYDADVNYLYRRLGYHNDEVSVSVRSNEVVDLLCYASQFRTWKISRQSK